MNKSNIFDLHTNILSSILSLASYGLFTFIVGVCVSFLLFAVINLTGGNVNFSNLGIQQVVIEWFGI